MKLLLLILFSIPYISMAQIKDTSITEIDNRLQKASAEMVKFDKWFQTGASIEVLGGVIIALGSTNNDIIKNKQPVIISGVVVTLVGFLISISSSTHIKNAGIILRGNGIAIPIKSKKR